MASAETSVKLDSLIAKVEVLKLEESDVLVLTCDQYLTASQRDTIREVLFDALPKDIRYLILDKGMKFQVIRKDELRHEDTKA